MSVGEFLDMMPDTVMVEPFVGQDDYGNPVYGPSQSYQARIVGETRRVVSTTGEEKVSSKTVYVGAAVQISAQDRITLPAGHEPQQPPVLSVGVFPDGNGLHHIEVAV